MKNRLITLMICMIILPLVGFATPGKKIYWLCQPDTTAANYCMKTTIPACGGKDKTACLQQVAKQICTPNHSEACIQFLDKLFAS